MAITKFIKDLFVVEEEVPVNDKKAEQAKTPAKVTNLNTNKQPNSRQKEAAPKKSSTEQQETDRFETRGTKTRGKNKSAEQTAGTKES